MKANPNEHFAGDIVRRILQDCLNKKIVICEECRLLTPETLVAGYGGKGARMPFCEKCAAPPQE